MIVMLKESGIGGEIRWEIQGDEEVVKLERIAEALPLTLMASPSFEILRYGRL